MLKKWLTYMVFQLSFVGLSFSARADIEGIQGAVMGPIQTVLQEAKAIQEDLNEIKSELRSAAEGIAGPVKDAVKAVNEVKSEVQSGIDMAKNAVSDPMSAMGSKMPGFLGNIDINNQTQLQEAIKGSYFARRPKALAKIESAVSKAKSGAADVRAAAGGMVASAKQQSGAVPFLSSDQNVVKTTVSSAASVKTAPLQKSVVSATKSVSSANSRTVERLPVQSSSTLNSVSRAVEVKKIQPVRQAFTTGQAASAKAASKLEAGKAKLNETKEKISALQDKISASSSKPEAAKGNLSELKENISSLKDSISTAQAASATSKTVSASPAVSTTAKAAPAAVPAIKSVPETLPVKQIEPLSGKKDGAEIKNLLKTSVYKSSETLMFGAEETAAETDWVRVNREQEEKMAALQRENFANLYAQAFTIRTNLAKEKTSPNKKENTRDLIQDIKKQSLEMAKRLRKFMIMEAGLYEFKMSQQARQFSYAEEDDDE